MLQGFKQVELNHLMEAHQAMGTIVNKYEHVVNMQAIVFHKDSSLKGTSVYWEGTKFDYTRDINIQSHIVFLSKPQFPLFSVSAFLCEVLLILNSFLLSFI